jgi:hypothetical protein
MDEPLEFLGGPIAPAPPTAAALRKALARFESSLLSEK